MKQTTYPGQMLRFSAPKLCLFPLWSALSAILCCSVFILFLHQIKDSVVHAACGAKNHAPAAQYVQTGRPIMLAGQTND
jgi:hypothetical protein